MSTCASPEVAFELEKGRCTRPIPWRVSVQSRCTRSRVISIGRHVKNWFLESVDVVSKACQDCGGSTTRRDREMSEISEIGITRRRYQLSGTPGALGVLHRSTTLARTDRCHTLAARATRYKRLPFLQDTLIRIVGEHSSSLATPTCAVLTLPPRSRKASTHSTLPAVLILPERRGALYHRRPGVAPVSFALSCQSKHPTPCAGTPIDRPHHLYVATSLMPTHACACEITRPRARS